MEWPQEDVLRSYERMVEGSRTLSQYNYQCKFANCLWRSKIIRIDMELRSVIWKEVGADRYKGVADGKSCKFVRKFGWEGQEFCPL